MTGRVLGAVLAGGASSRFGSDKALARVGGRTLLDLAQAELAPWVDRVVVIGRDGGVPDLPEPGLGPLGGIAGALTWGRERGFESVLTLGCDMPAVPAALLQALREAAPAYCANAPVLGHWPTAAADILMTLLADATSSIPSSRPRAEVYGVAPSAADAPAEPWMPGQARHDGVGGRYDHVVRAASASPTPSSRPCAGIQGSAHSTAAAHAEPAISFNASPKNLALSVRRWTQTIGATAIPAPAPLHNVNTPADLPA